MAPMPGNAPTKGLGGGRQDALDADDGKASRMEGMVVIPAEGLDDDGVPEGEFVLAVDDSPKVLINRDHESDDAARASAVESAALAGGASEPAGLADESSGVVDGNEAGDGVAEAVDSAEALGTAGLPKRPPVVPDDCSNRPPVLPDGCPKRPPAGPAGWPKRPPVGPAGWPKGTPVDWPKRPPPVPAGWPGKPPIGWPKTAPVAPAKVPIGPAVTGPKRPAPGASGEPNILGMDVGGRREEVNVGIGEMFGKRPANCPKPPSG